MTPRQKNRYFWTTIILLVMLPFTIFAAVMAIRYFTGASGETTPKNVIISNITSNSVSITWTTDTATSGSVTVNAGKGDGAPFVDIRGTDRRKTHHVDIVDLDPVKDYSFSILSNDQRYADEKGKSFKFRTSPVTSETPVPKPVYGAVDGVDKDDVVVYITLDGKSSVYPASSATTASGKWIIDLSALRDPSSNSLVKIDQNTKITITAKGTDTLGGTVNGTYGELVDSEGQLTTQIQLSDVPTDTLYASIPKVSQIAAITTPTTSQNGGNQNTDNPGTTPTDNNDDGSDVIVSDVTWTVISGTDTGTGSSAVTGSSSLKITNVTDTGFSVVWASSTATSGSIKYGISASSLSDTGIDERDSATNSGKYTVHSVTVTRLTPETTYYFEAYDDTTKIDSGQVKTYKTLSNPPEYKSITGKISNYSSDTVVVFTVSNGSKESTVSSVLADSGGSWIATLGDLRSSDGSDYFATSDTNTIKVSALSLSSIKSTSTTVKKAVDSGVTLTSSSATTRKIVKVPALASYGLYSGTIASSSSNLPADTGSGFDKSATIPKTAISTPLIYTIAIAVVSIMVGIFAYIKNNTKYQTSKEKHTMVSSVN